MHRHVLTSLALLLPGTTPAQTLSATTPAGAIADPVVCAADPEQSYVLYLPPGYSSDERWPVLYLLDPRGRGRLAVDLYRDAAARHGYVLVGSNNTRSDGPTQPNFDAMQALFDDSFARYSVDPDRIYVAGMSGTARAACEIAARARGKVSGLILVGASCAADPRLERTVAIDFLNVVGEADFNYREVQLFDDRLDRLGLSHLLLTFDGPHGWHGAVEAERALEWIELRAMSRGSRAVDDLFVDRRFDALRTKALAAERARQPLAAWYLYRDLLRSFDGLRSLEDVHDRFTALGREPQVTQSVRRRRALLREERKRTVRAARVLEVLDEPDPRPSVRTLAARLEIDRLRSEMSEAPRDEALLARRLFESLLVEVSFYIPARLRAKGDTAGAELSLALADAIGEAVAPRPSP